MNKTLLIIAAMIGLSGCSTLVSNAASNFTDNFTNTILNHDDPELVRAGAPTLLLTVDSLIQGDAENADLLAAGATLYATYGAVFANEKVRASRLTSRGRRYAARAICEIEPATCDWQNANFNDFVAVLPTIGEDKAEFLYAYGFASLAYLRAHSDDWNSLAELPQIEALFDHYLTIGGDDMNAGVYTFMGILLTLRPPALGGEPERARVFFETAIEVSNGNDLGAKVEFARNYAKLLYERELHDRLLNEVLAADPYQDGYVLSNVMAQEEAQALLRQADEYF